MKRLAKVMLCLVLAIGLVYSPVYLPAVETTPAVAVAEAATVKISKKSATIYAGETLQLKMNGTKKKATWTSSAKSVATVSSKGVVTAKKAGKATITAKVGGKKYTCKVTVKNPTLNKKTTSLYVGKTATLKVTGTSKKVSWSSSKSSVASVSSKGKITAKAPGTATITAKFGGKKLTCKVTVKTIMTVAKTAITVEVGETKAVTVTYKGAGSVDAVSSSKSVASVGFGKWKGDKIDLFITGDKAGTATITVKNTENKETKKIKVTVKKALPEVDMEAVAYNVNLIKDHIVANGDTNRDGQKFIVKQLTDDGMMINGGVIYDESKKELDFEGIVILEDGEDESQTVVSMRIPMKGTEKPTVEVSCYGTTDGTYYIFGSKTSFPVNDYNGKASKTFEITGSNEALPEKELKAISNAMMQMAFSAWESCLAEQLGMSMVDVGFVSYSL